MKLIEFAWYNESDKLFQQLDEMSNQKWDDNGKTDVTKLRSYIEDIFLKRNKREEGEIFQTDEYAMFDTGLHTVSQEPIYAYFTQSKCLDGPIWRLDGFYTKCQLEKKI